MTIVSDCPSPHFFIKAWSEYNGKIPFVITSLTKQLKEMKCLELEGIFRLSGSKNNVTQLCKELDKGPVSSFDEYTDINTIASAYKKYIAQVSEKHNIINSNELEIIGEIISSQISDDEKILKISQFFNTMDPSRRNVFAYICAFLFEIKENNEKTKMTAYNLSVCFTPSFYQSAEKNLITICAFIFENADKIFKPEWYSEKLFMTDMDILMLSAPEISIEELEIESERRRIREGSTFPFDFSTYCTEE